MTNDAISNAATRLAAIRVEIEALEAEAVEIEEALQVMRRYGAGSSLSSSLGNSEPAATATAARHIELSHANATVGFPMSQAEFEVLATRAMNETGRPMTRSQLLRWLEANATPLHGLDASKNAGTKLWRARDKFINLRGAGYWFRDRACPLVAYDPGFGRDRPDHDAAPLPKGDAA